MDFVEIWYIVLTLKVVGEVSFWYVLVQYNLYFTWSSYRSLSNF